MTVTDNLYHLLLRIRHPENMRRLWIDQICIDQDNNPEKLEEKTAQVGMMAEVYSAADNVLIWLGEEGSETATAFGMMEWMAATLEMSEQQVGCGSLIEYLLRTEDLPTDEAEDPVLYKQTIGYLKSLLIHVQPTAVTHVPHLAPPNGMFINLLGGPALTARLVQQLAKIHGIKSLPSSE